MHTIHKVAFRKATRAFIEKNTIHINDLRGKYFKKKFGVDIQSIYQVEEEDTVTVPHDYNTPVGLIYRRDGVDYALGITDFTGIVNVDEIFQIEVPKLVHYELWGEYQRVGWSVREILRLLSWRIRFMETPHLIQTKDIVLFEKSRWILFAFWTDDLERLVRLEIKIAQIIFQLHGRIGGTIKERDLNGRTMEEFETYLKKQYETKFVFNDVETSFVRRQASFGKHVKTLIKGSTLGNI